MTGGATAEHSVRALHLLTRHSSVTPSFESEAPPSLFEREASETRRRRSVPSQSPAARNAPPVVRLQSAEAEEVGEGVGTGWCVDIQKTVSAADRGATGSWVIRAQSMRGSGPRGAREAAGGGDGMGQQGSCAAGGGDFSGGGAAGRGCLRGASANGNGVVTSPEVGGGRAVVTSGSNRVVAWPEVGGGRAVVTSGGNRVVASPEVGGGRAVVTSVGALPTESEDEMMSCSTDSSSAGNWASISAAWRGSGWGQSRAGG